MNFLFTEEEIWEMYLRETRKQERKRVSLSLYNDGMPVETIARHVKESVEQVQKWLSEPPEDEDEEDEEDDDEDEDLTCMEPRKFTFPDSRFM